MLVLYILMAPESLMPLHRYVLLADNEWSLNSLTLYQSYQILLHFHERTNPKKKAIIYD